MRKENQTIKPRYVYLITNNINGKTYIGQHTFNVDKIDDGYLGSGKLIRRAIIKYGKSNFSKSILYINYNCTIDEISEVEKYYIHLAKLSGKAEYNITNGGESWGSIGMLANTKEQRIKAAELGFSGAFSILILIWLMSIAYIIFSLVCQYMVQYHINSNSTGIPDCPILFKEDEDLIKNI